MIVEFSLTCVFDHVWEDFFNWWCSHSLKMHWIYAFLLMPQFPVQNSRYTFLKICFSPKVKGVEKTMICFIKFNQEILAWLAMSVYLYFVLFLVFLDVIALQFCELYLSNLVVLRFLPLLCNHDNLTLNLHQTK